MINNINAYMEMSFTKKIAIYALTQKGVGLAHTLAAELDGVVYATSRHAKGDSAQAFESLPALVGETFAQYDAHVFIAAAGIVVRCIAPR